MKKKILVADDSAFIRKVVKEALSEKYKVIQASSGAKAIAKFKEEKPDLVLLDIIMPEGEEEGLSVLKKIIKSNSKTKVIMITAVGQDTIRKECKKLGAAAYIVKPFDEDEVVKAAEKALND